MTLRLGQLILWTTQENYWVCGCVNKPATFVIPSTTDSQPNLRSEANVDPKYYLAFITLWPWLIFIFFTDTVLALQSAIDGERLARMSPKSGYC